MPTGFVQSTSAVSDGTSATTLAAPSLTYTSGNLIAVYAACGATGDTITITDGANTYTSVDTLSAGGDTMTTFYAKNISGGARVVTANFSPSAGFRMIIVHEISGAHLTTPLDGAAHAINFQASPGTGTDAVTSGSVTTTTSGDYIFGAVRVNNTVSDTLTAGTNYTSRENSSGSASTTPYASEDRIQSAAGAIAATFTESTNQQTTTCIMAFSPSGAVTVLRYIGKPAGLMVGL